MTILRRFLKPTSEIIKIRQSCRTYQPNGLSSEEKTEISEFISNLPQTPFSQFGSKARFGLIDMNEIEPSQAKQLGTYGFIKGTRQFLVGCVNSGDNNLEHYAYLFELIILKATDMGLGTCWLGGSYNKSGFAKAFINSSEEYIPAVSPIGHIADNRHFTDKIIRFSINAKARFPWSKLFFEGNFSTPLKGDNLQQFRSVLEMVRLGPSASNGQPWRIIKDPQKNIFHFYVYDPRKGQSGLTQFRRLDLGIACAHFDLMCQELNFKGQWIFEDPQLKKPADTIYRFSWIEKIP